MAVKIDATKALKQLSKSLADLQRKQIPFAMALTLTSLVQMAQAEEKKELPSLFDHPTPVTVNSVAVKKATKSSLTAMVFYRDIAAQYLEPFEDGHALPRRQTGAAHSGWAEGQSIRQPAGLLVAGAWWWPVSGSLAPGAEYSDQTKRHELGPIEGHWRSFKLSAGHCGENIEAVDWRMNYMIDLRTELFPALANRW